MDENKKKMLRTMGFNTEVDRVERGDCPECGQHVNLLELRDRRSMREWEISGYCMACQDKTFGRNDESV